MKTLFKNHSQNVFLISLSIILQKLQFHNFLTFFMNSGVSSFDVTLLSKCKQNCLKSVQFNTKFSDRYSQTEIICFSFPDTRVPNISHESITVYKSFNIKQVLNEKIIFSKIL